MLNVQSQHSDPYGPLIERFITSQFPANLDDAATVLDGVTEAFLASAQVRYGPRPSPESLVVIRQVISHWIEQECSIPVLVPWGSKKAQVGEVLDLAELMAFRQLQCLNERVKRFYPRGIGIRLRIEELGGYYLWRNEPENVRRASEEYVSGLLRLVDILDLSFVRPVLEGDGATEQEFIRTADQFYDPLVRYLNGDATAQKELALLGWKGSIPKEQRDFYYGQYEHMYPGTSQSWRTEKLAAYFAQSATRYRLGLATDPNWGGKFIQLNFPQPVPGIPESLSSNRIHYRTVPMRFSRTHIPPWRAKGYLEISEQGDTIPKIVSPRARLPLVSHDVVLSRDGQSVLVAADYLIR